VLTSFGGGSPMVMELAEELAVMGTKKMVLMTWGGTLQTNIKPGDIIVCNRAIRDEGASHHYLPPEKLHALLGRTCLVRSNTRFENDCVAHPTLWIIPKALSGMVKRTQRIC